MVNYNSKDLTYKAIQDIEKSCVFGNYEIIIVDNGSSDGSREFFEDVSKRNDKVKYIYISQNLGFAKANNIGAKRVSGDILVFINPDIMITRKGFDEFIINNLKNDIGILSPKIVYPNGSIQPNCGGFSNLFTYVLQLFRVGYISRKLNIVSILSKIVKILGLKNTVIAKYLLYNFNPSNRIEKNCDWVSGACIIIRKKIFDEVGGFDEKFFMYCEDEDLCRRVRKLGYDIVVNNSFEIIHIESGTHSGRTDILSNVKRERFKSNIYFIYKYYGKSKANILRLLYIFFFFVSAAFYLFKFNLRSFKDRLNFISELLKYNLDLK